MKFLIVDDDPIIRRLLEEILEDEGRSDLAENGKEAAILFEKSVDEKEYYDLVLMDIKMPVMDGHQALSRIRELEVSRSLPESNRSKVVMMSSFGDRDNVVSALNKGCDQYLVKPFNPEKISEIVSKTIKA